MTTMETGLLSTSGAINLIFKLLALLSEQTGVQVQRRHGLELSILSLGS